MSKRLLLACLGCAIVLPLLAIYVPLPVPYQQDFSVLYFADRALLRGIALYDYPAQLPWVLSQTSPDFTFHPYPYPPWYALAALPLALLPIQAAARLWFLVNLLLLGAATWLLTPGWRPLTRLLALPGAILFIPAFGLLVVGQYSLPVLLGVALFIWAARAESAPGAALGLGLMTFKPHLGLFLGLAAFFWLFQRRGTLFARRALLYTGLLALALALFGQLADPAVWRHPPGQLWPLAYLQSLARYRDLPGVQSCGLCASLSVGLVGLVSGQANIGQAAAVSVGLGLGLGVLFYWRFRSRLGNPTLWMALSAVFTLLVDPYLLNYDYVLLLVPLTVGWGAGAAGLLTLTAYLLPWVGLLLGRAGNPLLALSTLLVIAALWRER